MEINILKCHGSENEFILIDELDTQFNWTDETRTQFSITLCDRTNGIGADGILFLQTGPKVRIFNSDGSEATMCGNGLRCSSRYYCEKHNVESVTFETKGGFINTYKTSNIYDDIETYCVEIGPINFNLDKLPMNWTEKTLVDKVLGFFDNTMTFTAVTIPNPHLISIVDSIYSFGKLEAVAKKANTTNPYFPDGVNVTFVKVMKNGAIYTRTYERGVGFTNACGTAMSAASYIVTMLGYETNNNLEIYNDGGSVLCQVSDTHINLIGNATYEFTAKINYNINSGDFYIFDKTNNLIDTQNYAFFKRKSVQFLQRKL